MKIYKEHPGFIKLFGLTFIGTRYWNFNFPFRISNNFISAGWIYYQVKKTRYVLEHSLDTTVLSVKNLQIETKAESEEYFNLESFYPYEKRNFFRTTWDAIKFAYARRLIRVANSSDKEFRIKAITNLAKIKNLDQWHCSLLASMMGPRVAVALARSRGVDKRILLEPPLRYHNYNKVMLTNAMRDLLICLYEHSGHACLGYFLSKVFVYEHVSKVCLIYSSLGKTVILFIGCQNYFLSLNILMLVCCFIFEKIRHSDLYYFTMNLAFFLIQNSQLLLTPDVLVMLY